MELSIIVPTYNERKNIEPLVKKIFAIFKKNRIKGEVIVVDDNSPDGTGLIAEKLRREYKNLKVLNRAKKLGLSSAVLDGLNIAEGDVFGVMDADLSHPPETIPRMFKGIKEGSDFVIGSRYVKHGRIKGVSVYRRLVSILATFMARTVTSVKDPLSGFFMIKRVCVEGKTFNNQGIKICLEFLVKGSYKNVKEVPMTFINRKNGKSKIGPTEFYLYLRNLFSYLAYDKPFYNIWNLHPDKLSQKTLVKQNAFFLVPRKR